MNLTATKTETIEVDVTDIYDKINNIQQSIDNIPKYDFHGIDEEISHLNESISNIKDSLKEDVTQDLYSSIDTKINSLSSKFKDLEKISNTADSSIVSIIQNLSDKVENLELKSTTKQSNPNVPFEPSKFEFILEKDEDGFSDKSWEDIIKKGQELQYDYYKAAEDKYSKIWPLFAGWHGSAMAPVIKIICEEPEYHFKDTKRLPGRFCLSSDRRWSSVLRFYGDGGKVLKDTIPYGTATNAPIGLYVEGKTKVQTSKGEMLMKPFEQTIEDVIICAHNGVLPIYLSMNQDRFCIRGAKILQHQGALIGIKHGPIINETNYPFPAVQDTEGNNVYLADPRFENLQMEGPHTNKRPQAAMLLSGNNIIISNLNLYGWMQGPYMHGGQNRLINGLVQHWGNTHDGRMYCSRDEIVSYTVCYKDNTKNTDSFSGIAGNFKQWYLAKRSRVPSKGGWHTQNQYCL